MSVPVSKGMPSMRLLTRIAVYMDQLCLSVWTELLRYDGWVNWWIEGSFRWDPLTLVYNFDIGSSQSRLDIDMV